MTVHTPSGMDKQQNVTTEAVTQDWLLSGRIAYTQSATGFRSGIEPVLLAAALPARTGERVLEGGSGAGAALLCLAARIPGIKGIGVERDPALAALAQRNADANSFAHLTFVAADITTMAECGPVDHAMANPPYHPATGTASPNPMRAQAKHAAPDLLPAWTRALAAPLRHRGTLTFILPAGTLPDCIGAMVAADCRVSTILPLWPKAGQPAKLVLVQAVKGGRASSRLLPGLVLHRTDGSFTAEADAILREGKPLPMA